MNIIEDKNVFLRSVGITKHDSDGEWLTIKNEPFFKYAIRGSETVRIHVLPNETVCMVRSKLLEAVKSQAEKKYSPESIAEAVKKWESHRPDDEILVSKQSDSGATEWLVQVIDLKDSDVMSCLFSELLDCLEKDDFNMLGRFPDSYKELAEIYKELAEIYKELAEIVSQ